MMTAGTNQRGYDIGETLNRRTTALSVCHHVNDARQHCLGSHPLCTHDQRSRAVQGPADHLRAGSPSRRASTRR